jgi:hypothetical protein
MTITAGEQAKFDGMTLADLAASVDWKRRWDMAIRYLALRGEPFTTDEIRQIAGPPEDHPNAAGARLNSAARAGVIRSIGYAKSKRDVLHSHPLTLWVGA